MKTRFLFLIGILLAVLAHPLYAQTQPVSPELTGAVSPCLLKSDLRKLWYDHSVWSRTLILGIVDELPGGEEAFIRLLENQDDKSRLLSPYLSETAGAQLLVLLKAHTHLMGEVVRAIKNNTTSQFDNASKRWFANGEELAFLLSAHINLPREELSMLLQEHLTLTKAMALQRMDKNYGAEIIAYDKVNNHLLLISDLLAEGIIKQFSEKLKPVSVH